MNRNCIVGLLCLFLIVTTPQSALGLENVSCLARGSQTVCYTAVRNLSDFTHAEAECGRLHPDGRLATIMSPDNQRHLEDYLIDGDYWIGARLKRLGGWTWIDGTNDVHWLGIPELSTRRYAKIHIKEHGYEVNVIPAYDNPTPNETALCRHCGDVSDNCYFVREASRWRDARNACLSKGADLATLSNSSLHQLITKSIIGPGYYFVGLRNAIFVWRGTSDEVKYTDWLDTDPIDHQECVLLGRSRTSGQWKWATANCSDKDWFVCEYATAATEDKGVTSNISLYIIILAVLLSLAVIGVMIIVCVVHRRRTVSSSNGTPQSYDKPHVNNKGDDENQTIDLTYATIAPQPADGDTAAGGDNLLEGHASKEDCKKPNQYRTSNSKLAAVATATVPPAAAASDGAVYASIMTASAASQQRDETNEYEVPVPNVVYASFDTQ